MSRRHISSDLSTFAGRVRAWLHFLFIDHHILRLVWTNLHQIAPGVWRSNQPGPGRIARYGRMGIANVVSLRGDMPVSFNLLEARACARAGIGLRNLPGVTARNLASGEVLLRIVDEIAGTPGPVLFHCKSGADRTGFVAALYLILHGGVPVAKAARQLSVRHIHFSQSASGVLDHVFRVYLRDAAPSGTGFRDWMRAGYDPATIEADFKDWRRGAGRWAR